MSPLNLNKELTGYVIIINEYRFSAFKCCINHISQICFCCTRRWKITLRTLFKRKKEIRDLISLKIKINCILSNVTKMELFCFKYVFVTKLTITEKNPHLRILVNFYCSVVFIYVIFKSSLDIVK